MSFLTIKPVFKGHTVVVMATGPSLTQEQVNMVRDARFPVIAVNNAYEYALWAYMLYASDAIWWEKYRESGKLGGPGNKHFTGLKVTLGHARVETRAEYLAIDPPDFDDVRHVGFGGTFGFDPRPDYVRGGKNSACPAVQLAIKGGASRVLLLGCDCKTDEAGNAHFFGEHEWWEQGRRSNRPFNAFIEGWQKLAAEIPVGVEVLNCTPGSAIDCFPKLDLEEVINDPAYQ